MRLPQGGLSAGKGRLKVVTCPRWGSDPATSWGPEAAVIGCPLGCTGPTARATRSSEAGTVRGLCCHSLSREGKGVWGGQDRPGGEREGTRGGEAAGRRHLRRERVQGKGSGKWRQANRRRPLRTAIQPGVMPSPPPTHTGRILAGGPEEGGGLISYWAPRTWKRLQQEHWQQRPTERSDPTQHAKGRTGDCPGPRKVATTRGNATQGVHKPPSQPVRWGPTARFASASFLLVCTLFHLHL